MAVRLHFIVEGQTEETFVNQVLRPHLAYRSIVVDARCIQTSRKGGTKHRGGINNYELPKQDIFRWIREDRRPDARFTTMFDLYGLPQEFPGRSDAGSVSIQVVEYICRCSQLDGFAVTICFTSCSAICQTLKTI